MRLRVTNLLAGGCLSIALAATALGQQGTGAADSHVAAARAAAGQEHRGLFDAVCSQTSLRTPAPKSPAASSGPRQTPPRSQWYAEPVKVFDNLYWVGQTEYSAWAVTTSDGIILIDTIYDYAVEAEVVDGLKKLGLDAAAIKYAIVSHGHADHHGGARYLQDHFGTRVIMAAPDWDLVQQNTTVPSPKRDMVASDGQKLTLGDTTVTLYLTPGHTTGTISTLVPVKDQGRPHLAASWGGTLFVFQRTPENFRRYIASAERFRGIVARAGADVLISNHTIYDGSKIKQPALATRKPGDPHPYVIGTDAVSRYLTVAAECAKAALAGLTTEGQR